MLVALLLGAWGVAPAWAASPGDSKPVAVVSLFGYDEMAADVRFLGELTGEVDLLGRSEAILNFLTQGKGLAGLDKTRPSGAAVYADGDRPTGYVFLPITDLDALHDLLKPFLAGVTDVGDRVYKVEGKGPGQTIFVKEGEGGWLFASDKLEALGDLPEDPRKLLAGLDQQYDVAVRLNVSNVPEAHRQKLIARLEEDTQKQLQRRPGEGDEEYTVRKIVTEHLLRAILSGVHELEQITLGWSLDRKAELACVELSATAVEGTGAARELARLGQTKTKFGGLRLSDAVLTGNWAGTYYLGGTADLATVFDAVRSKAFDEIDEKVDGKQRAAAAKDVVGGLMDVARGTVESGKIDGVVSVVLNPEGATLLVGKYVADGDKMEETLGRLVEAVRDEHPGFVDRVLTPFADECEGVHLHFVSIPVPPQTPDRDKVVQLVGENLEIVVGIGRESFYLSMGKDAMKTLKEAIEKSAADGDQATAPMEVTVSLERLAKFVANMGPDRERPKAEKAAEILQQADGKDHVRLVASPIERGVKYRLELEKGVLKLIPAMQKMR
ncbi:MAG: hypothetical protein A2V70_15130 [Planctomycetes bacterium RBG_13_63_9]|nr:MAG: hypothetical protein A2V70_15130 [Planctomycetes bacterium RBG_13_63_9]